MLLTNPLVRRSRRLGRDGQRLAFQAGRSVLGTAMGRLDPDTLQRVGGSDRALRLLFGMLARMVATCRPELRADVQFVIDTPDGERRWRLRATESGVHTQPGELEAPDLTLRLTLADLLDLAGGRTTGIALAARDRIDIDGDLVAALAIMRAAEAAPPA